MLKVNNKNTWTKCEICSKLTIKTLVNFEHFSNLVQVFQLLTLSKFMPAGIMEMPQQWICSELTSEQRQKPCGSTIFILYFKMLESEAAVRYCFVEELFWKHFSKVSRRLLWWTMSQKREKKNLHLLLHHLLPELYFHWTYLGYCFCKVGRIPKFIEKQPCRSFFLTHCFKMLKNGQAYFKNLTMFTPQAF